LPNQIFLVEESDKATGGFGLLALMLMRLDIMRTDILPHVGGENDYPFNTGELQWAYSMKMVTAVGLPAAVVGADLTTMVVRRALRLTGRRNIPAREKARVGMDILLAVPNMTL
jgi:hypothetical protein